MLHYVQQSKTFISGLFPLAEPARTLLLVVTATTELDLSLTAGSSASQISLLKTSINRILKCTEQPGPKRPPGVSSFPQKEHPFSLIALNKG